MNKIDFLNNYYKNCIEYQGSDYYGFRYNHFVNGGWLLRERTEKNFYTMLLANYIFRVDDVIIPPYSLLNLIS